MSLENFKTLDLVRSELIRRAPAFGLKIDRDLERRLLAYCDLLLRWNRSMSLVSESSASRLVQYHLLESLYVTQFLAKDVEEVVDVGSGAGLPGVIIALRRPQIRVHLLEPNMKKSIFLMEIARNLKLANLCIFRGRYQEFESKSASAVVTRALERLPSEVPHLIRHFCYVKQFLLLLGGKNPPQTHLPSKAWSITRHAVPMSERRYVLDLRRIDST